MAVCDVHIQLELVVFVEYIRY